MVFELFLAVIAAEPFTKKESLVSRMVENGWVKSIKAALLGGLVGLLGFVAEAEELIAYYKAGYIGDHASSATDALKLTATSGGDDLSYTREHGTWTLIIDENSPSDAQAWCANTVKYNDFAFTIAKVIIKRGFTFKPGVTAALFDNVEIEVAEGVKLTMTNYGLRNMSLGAVTFSGDGEVDASSGVTFTKPITTKGNVTVKTPANAFVATVDGTEYLTLTDAFNAAKPNGTIRLVGWPTSNLPAWTDSAQWQGTVQFTGTMPNGFTPANYGNASSTIEFKGVSGGYLVQNGSFAGTLKVTNDGKTPGWSPKDGYSTDNFVFGALTGDGDIVAGDSSVTQQYSFKDASTFGGSMTTSSKRLVIGETTHGSNSQFTSRIYIEKGHVVRIAEGKTLSGKWGMVIDGTIIGSGTLDSPSNKIVVFKFANYGDPAIDLSEGAPTIAENCVAYFYQTLILKNAQPGMAVLYVSAAPTNMTTVQLKDENGVRSDWMLAYESKNGVVRLLSKNHTPQTLYWNDYRGTFWERLGGSDLNGNHGILRDENGEECPYIPGDTVIFDKTHYTSSEYWNYNENLYIKSDVKPAEDVNVWDMKILEGVTLKMGLRGARATGQNIIRDFKIYVEDGSTLELGYWGNTHHYQGVIRPDVTFGGLGAITLGDDMGASCRIEGDLKVKGDDVPTLDVRGKELVVQGGRIDVNLTGFGALSGSGTITTPITFNNATISATTSPGFTFKNETTFTGTLTVDMTSAPTGEELIKICTKGQGGSFVFKEGIDVVVRVGGAVQPAFYTLATDSNGDLCVKVAPVQIDYSATVRLGYDYKTMIVDVDMNPAIDGVVAEVAVADVEGKLQHWSAPVVGMRNQGRAEVMVGDADDNFVPGTYSMTVSVGSWQQNLNFTLSVGNGGNLATVDGVDYKTMREAVAEAEAARGTVKLLTNVFFAAPEGTYAIDRNGFDVKTTNYTTIDALANKVTAEDEIVFTREGEGITRVVVAGDWIAAGLPWRTKKTIDAAIWSNSAEMAPFEAYILGFDAEDALTAKVIARGVQTDDPDTIELSDGLTSKSAAQTGVVVTKKLVDADTKAEVSATTTYDLTKMANKSSLLKLSYDFTADHGQE